MKDLQQFVGSIVEAVGGSEDAVWLTLRLPNGDQRDVAVYCAFNKPVAVRIDGQYCPPEDL